MQSGVKLYIIVLPCSLLLGNHEYYTRDVDNWIAEVGQLNIKPLVNQRQCLYSTEESCGNGVYIAGLEDYETRYLR